MKVLIAGGTGFVGSALTRKLIQKGHKVILLARPETARKVDISKSLSVLETDFMETGIPVQNSLDALINCVGIIREFPSKGITFKKAHIDLVNYLVTLARINDIRRFIQVSALGTGPTADTEYFRTKFMAEELLLASNLNTTILRPSIIYGPGDQFINMIARFVGRFSVMPVIGKGEYRFQPVHIGDLCEVIVRSLDDPFTFERIFDIGGPETFSFNQIVETVANALGKRARRFHQPVFVMRILAALFERFPWFPVSRDQITMLFKENYTDDTRLFEHYGISPRTLPDGIRDYL